MRSILALFCAASVLSACARDAAPASEPDPAVGLSGAETPKPVIDVVAAAPRWTPVPSESALTFTATQFGKPFEGRFADYSASIFFDPNDLAASLVVVEIDMRSAKTGDAQRDLSLVEKDWFAASDHPMARFEASEIVAVGDGYEARGTLKIRNVARPLALPFSLAIEGDTARASGAVSILRTDFGVGQGEFSTDEFVGFDVTISFKIVARKA